MPEEFDLHEDEWGMIGLVPAENRGHTPRTVDEAQRASAEVPLSVRGLVVDDLATLIGAGWRRFAHVVSGQASHRQSVADAFAFSNGEVTLYGTLQGDVVSELHLDRRQQSSQLGDALHRLGRLQRLILVDLWQDRVVDLGDSAAVAAYLAGDDGDGNDSDDER